MLWLKRLIAGCLLALVLVFDLKAFELLYYGWDVIPLGETEVVRFNPYRASDWLFAASLLAINILIGYFTYRSWKRNSSSLQPKRR